MDQKETYKNSYETYAKEIFRFLAYKLGNREQAEDMTAEVFEALFKTDITQIQNVRAWLFRVARNKLYDTFNKSGLDEVSVVESEEGEPYEFEDNLNLEKVVLEESLIKVIENEMSTLSNIEKDIIVMRVWDEMKFTEIADAVNLAEDSVKKKFYRSVEKIRSNLEKKDQNFRTYSFAIPAVLFGLGSISKASAYAASGSLLKNISVNLLGLKIMTGTESVVGATVAGATKGGFSLFGLAGAKLAAAIVSTVAVASTVGVGAVYVAKNNDQKEPEQVETQNQNNNEEEQEVAVDSPEDTFSTADFKEYSFSINPLPSYKVDVKLRAPAGTLLDYEESFRGRELRTSQASFQMTFPYEGYPKGFDANIKYETLNNFGAFGNVVRITEGEGSYRYISKIVTEGNCPAMGDVEIKAPCTGFNHLLDGEQVGINFECQSEDVRYCDEILKSLSAIRSDETLLYILDTNLGFRLPMQESYEPVDMSTTPANQIDISKYSNNSNLQWSYKFAEGELNYGFKPLGFIRYSPERVFGLPCDVGCVGDTSLSFSWKRGEFGDLREQFNEYYENYTSAWQEELNAPNIADARFGPFTAIRVQFETPAYSNLEYWFQSEAGTFKVNFDGVNPETVMSDVLSSFGQNVN